MFLDSSNIYVIGGDVNFNSPIFSLPKKRGLKSVSIPSKGFSAANIPPAPQNLLVPATLLDNLKFHVISPPSLARLGLPASLAPSLVIRNIPWIKPSANHQLPC